MMGRQRDWIHVVVILALMGGPLMLLALLPPLSTWPAWYSGQLVLLLAFWCPLGALWASRAIVERMTGAK